MIHIEAPAGAGSPVAGPHDELKQVLAGYDSACKHSTKTSALFIKRPKFKPLVLSIVPDASVRRIGSGFECYIGGEHVQCRGMHKTADRAWACLARYVIRHGSEVQP